jgi:hypothetical protein
VAKPCRSELRPRNALTNPAKELEPTFYKRSENSLPACGVAFEPSEY